ncbi:lysine transporter LysE [Rhodobacterales bacterium 52_120_T64]|nr:lysine transporter LysE [Rhodobacterales bacterium 52_120_T64]
MISIEFLLTAFIVVIAPGTGVIYTIASGLSLGRKAAIIAAFGCTMGIVPHLLAAVLGLAAILHASALLFQFVKYAGVVFLFYMAWKTLKDRSALTLDQELPDTALRAIAVRGGLINILNPKLSLFFLAFLPQFLSGNSPSAKIEMVLLGAVFMVMTFVVFVIYGIFASAARHRVLESPRVLRALRYSFAAAFFALGLRLAGEKA